MILSWITLAVSAMPSFFDEKGTLSLRILLIVLINKYELKTISNHQFPIPYIIPFLKSLHAIPTFKL